MHELPWSWEVRLSVAVAEEACSNGLALRQNRVEGSSQWSRFRLGPARHAGRVLIAWQAWTARGEWQIRSTIVVAGINGGALPMFSRGFLRAACLLSSCSIPCL